MKRSTPPHPPARPRRAAWLAWLIVGLVGVAAGLGFHQLRRADPPHLEVAALLSSARPLPAFMLVDLDGHALDRRQLLGHYTLLFFGYTNCPDVCPTVLTELASAERSLLDLPPQRRPTVLFLSVDPGRDSPEVLARYVRHFNASFTGATGTDAVLTRIAASVGALYERRIGTDGSYQVDHTAAMFLINPKAELIAVFPAPHRAKSIAADYRAILQRTAEQTP